MWSQPPASNGTAEGLWEHRFQSASSWDGLTIWDSGAGQSSGGGCREPALSITRLAARRTTPTWEREYQASTDSCSSQWNDLLFVPWAAGQGRMVCSILALKPPRPCHLPGY